MQEPPGKGGFMDLSMKQTQQQMEQSVRILQMDSFQLTDYIKEVMLENPVLDMEPPKERGQALALKKMQWLEDQAKREQENTGYYEEEEDESLLEKAAAAPGETLTEHLLSQIAMLDGESALLPILRQAAYYVNSNGYLDAAEEDICRETHCRPEQVQKAIAALQKLDPPGVGARNLSECLLLQLEPDDRLARDLAASCLEDIAKDNRRPALAEQFQVSEDEIEKAIARIRRLNPKPGSQYGGSRAPQYIRPDIVVTAFEDRYYVMLCEFAYPEIHLNEGYLQMAKETEDPEVLAYINEKAGQIQWMQKCIENRNETLLTVAKAIVKCQERFFRYGPQHLNILRMRDIAEIVNLDESTVSRAVKDKYLQCAGGVYPLRYFFVKGLEGEVSAAGSENAKWELRRLIEEENHERPLSDQQLADSLNAAGVEISRRTVIQYREELGFPPASERAHSHSS